MKKLALFALTAATVLTTAGSPLLVQASAGNCVYGKLEKDGCVVIGGKVSSKEELNDILSKLEEELKNGKWNCIPDIVIPETGLPDNSNPEEDAPETEKPEENIPETETPGNGTSTPDNSEDTQELTYAKQVVKLVNEERVKAGLNELILDEEIEGAALIRAKEIKQSFSHTRPNGSSFTSVLKEQGITYRGAGENIAWGQTSPEAVMKGWMNSEGHRANILNPKFTKIGVGHYQDSNGKNYWTQLFTY